MIQNKTELFIKDNTGVIKGVVINSLRASSLGDKVTLAITKAKSKAGVKQKTSKLKSDLQDAVVVQTKKRVLRYDGSTIAFNSNSGVCISRSGAKSVLGFKRINTTVPFELKRRPRNINLIKLAKSLV